MNFIVRRIDIVRWYPPCRDAGACSVKPRSNWRTEGAAVEAAGRGRFTSVFYHLPAPVAHGVDKIGYVTRELQSIRHLVSAKVDEALLFI
jgi:hypothetical protein